MNTQSEASILRSFEACAVRILQALLDILRNELVFPSHIKYTKENANFCASIITLIALIATHKVHCLFISVIYWMIDF